MQQRTGLQGEQVVRNLKRQAPVANRTTKTIKRGKHFYLSCDYQRPGKPGLLRVDEILLLPKTKTARQTAREKAGWNWAWLLMISQ